jgi:hypothetical protein
MIASVVITYPAQVEWLSFVEHVSVQLCSLVIRNLEIIHDAQMVRDQDLTKWKENSQQYLKDAFNHVRFGLPNEQGIFGACPGEILHLVLIGWFKNVVDSFFIQIGRNSDKAKTYNTLLFDINQCLGWQSDRNVPFTKITKGFSTTANIPGHEYAGCLFVMLASLYTTCFNEIFGQSRAASAQLQKDKTLSNPAFLDD